MLNFIQIYYAITLITALLKKKMKFNKKHPVDKNEKRKKEKN